MPRKARVEFPEAVYHLLDRPTVLIMLRLFLFLIWPLIVASSARGADDAEILSRRVPNQAYLRRDTGSVLKRGDAIWSIPLWACDPATLTITKVLAHSAPAPYAIAISTGANNPIGQAEGGIRLYTIHLLAASKEDAEKMRRALITEIETIQRFIEKKQGNKPGFLKAAVHSWQR